MASSKRSPLAKLLVYLTPQQKKAKPRSLAHVLTSAESKALLEEKAHKKQGEKGKRKEEKGERNEEESLKGGEKCQAQEREAKKAQKQKKS